MVKQHASCPASFGFTLQTVTEEVLPFCAQLLGDGRFVAHAHFVHDLKVVLVLMPGPLQIETYEYELLFLLVVLNFVK